MTSVMYDRPRYNPRIGSIASSFDSGFWRAEIGNIARGIPWAIGADSRDSTLSGNGRADDTQALDLLQRQANGALVLLGPGTYRVNSVSGFELSANIFALPGAVFKPDAGSTLAVSGNIVQPAGPSRLFDISNAGAVATAGRANPGIYSEWWGAVSVPSETVDQTLAQSQLNATALDAAGMSAFGNTIRFGGVYTVTAGMTFAQYPNAAGFTVSGAGGSTRCGLKPHISTPSISLFDFTNYIGPQLVVEYLQTTGYTGASSGVATGFDLHNANGVLVVNCWGRGNDIAFRLRGSNCSIVDSYVEFNTVGVLVDTNDPKGGQIRNLNGFNNAGPMLHLLNCDCSGLDIDGISSTGGAQQCIVIENAHRGSMRAVSQVYDVSGNVTTADTLVLKGNSDGWVIDGVVCRDNGGTAVTVQDTASNNRITNVDISGATHGPVTGISATTTGTGNVIDGYRVTGCTTGQTVASTGVAYRNGVVTGNTTNFAVTATLGYVESFNVQSDTYGDFKSDLTGAANKINALGYADLHGRRRFVGSAAPTSGAFLQGDLIEDQAATSGGFIGRVCTVAGSPGTWKTYGVIS